MYFVILSFFFPTSICKSYVPISIFFSPFLSSKSLFRTKLKLSCSSAVFAWKCGPWRESVYVSSNLTFWLFCRTSDSSLIPIVRHCTAYGSSNRSNKVGCENLSWHKHRFCYMARAGTTEHLNMLFFGYVSQYYLLEFTTFAVGHDPNASLSCAFTWKPLNCRLNCNNCYSGRPCFNVTTPPPHPLLQLLAAVSCVTGGNNQVRLTVCLVKILAKFVWQCVLLCVSSFVWYKDGHKTD